MKCESPIRHLMQHDEPGSTTRAAHKSDVPGLSTPAIRVVRAARVHITPLARHMRKADRHEVMASHGHTPFEALCAAFVQSTLAWTLLLEGVPAMMWGVAPGCTGPKLPVQVNRSGFRHRAVFEGSCTPQRMEKSGQAGQSGQAHGTPWMLGADSLHGAGLAIARQSRQYVACMQALYPYLENYVHSANLASIRWLLWCGFSLAPEPEPYGFSGELFYHFWRSHV